MMDDKKIAVLIDADNISSRYISSIFDEVSKFGTPTYKRIYGDWTKPNLGSWKDVLLEHSITPIQQYSYTTGKNATDSAMIIDAMDILYSGNVEGFCLISSDSDFTKLAARLRESGMYVIGMGMKSTPTAFRSACETFRYLEVLLPEPAVKKQRTTVPSGPVIDAIGTDLNEIILAIKAIVEEDQSDDGVYLSRVGSLLNKKYPDFDSRNYGYNKLKQLVISTKQFEVKRTKDSGVSFMVRIKNGDVV
ncbi:MAG: NYN domain-containing protein [Oscillospiraceae bacterium]|nr:NYN domain-containing protein [Oscillospiraceae bacterium]